MFPPDMRNRLSDITMYTTRQRIPPMEERMRAVTMRSMHRRPKEFPYSVVEYRSYYGCKLDLITTPTREQFKLDKKNKADIGSLMAKVTKDAGFGLRHIKVVHFKVGEGVTVAQILAESLADMHTYPERDGCAQVWLDYCNWQQDNSEKAWAWWFGVESLLEPQAIGLGKKFYVPVLSSREQLLRDRK